MAIEALGYIFAYCRRRPSSAAEASQLPVVAEQLRRFRKVEASGRIRLAKRVPDLTTNRQSVFFERRTFIELMQEASSAGTVVAVADLAALFRTVRNEKAGALIEMLKMHGARIWDATRGHVWDEFSEERRATILSEALTAKVSHSHLVKAGLTKAKRSSSTAVKENARRGRSANVARANNLAMRLKDILQEEKDKLPADALLSPSALASALNERNIPSARGKHWTHNSAKNLIERVRKLGEAAKP